MFIEDHKQTSILGDELKYAIRKCRVRAFYTKTGIMTAGDFNDT